MMYEEQNAKKRAIRCWDQEERELTAKDLQAAYCVIPNYPLPVDEDTLPNDPGAWIWFCGCWYKCSDVVGMCSEAIDYFHECG